MLRLPSAIESCGTHGHGRSSHEQIRPLDTWGTQDQGVPEACDREGDIEALLDAEHVAPTFPVWCRLHELPPYCGFEFLRNERP